MRDLPLRFFLQPGQRQIFEHHARQLIQRHLDFIRMLAWLIACQAVSRAVAIASHAAPDVTRLPWPLPDACLGLPVLEAVLIQVAQGNSHPFLPIRGDNRFLGDELPEVFADRLLDALIMPQTIFEAATAQFPWVVTWLFLPRQQAADIFQQLVGTFGAIAFTCHQRVNDLIELAQLLGVRTA